MKKIDVIVTASVLLVGIGFVAPMRAHSQEKKDAKVACRANLKKIAVACIEYADERRFYPHLEKVSKLDHGGDTTPKGNDVPPRCLRTLFFFDLLDDPKDLVCPASSDAAKPLGDEAKKDKKKFGWAGTTSAGKVSPLFEAEEKDKDADALTDLSYGYTVRGLTANSQGGTLLSSDRAARLGARTKQKIEGCHKDGWTTVKIDGSTGFVKTGTDDAKTLSGAKVPGGFLVVWDEANAGDEEKK